MYTDSVDTVGQMACILDREKTEEYFLIADVTPYVTQSHIWAWAWCIEVFIFVFIYYYCVHSTVRSMK